MVVYDIFWKLASPKNLFKYWKKNSINFVYCGFYRNVWHKSKRKKETGSFTLKYLFYQQIDAEDEKTLEKFMSSQPAERKTLADIIMEKINEKKTEIRSQISGRLHLDFCMKKTCHVTFETLLPTQHLLVQSQQKNHSGKMWNTFKVNNKNIRTTSLALFWCFYC